MSNSEAPPVRHVHTRRVVSMILSCLTIAASLPVLVITIADPARLLTGGTYTMPPLLSFLVDSTGTWIVPGVLSLVLLSSLPRPRSKIERLPKIFGIVAVVLSTSCILYLMGLSALFVFSFFIDITALFS